MLTRKQALLALALMTSLPLAVWAHADNDNFGGPGQGYGPGMMQGQGYGSGMMQGQGYGPGMMQGQGYGFGMMQGQGYGPGMMQGYGPFGYMNDTDNLKAQLDVITSYSIHYTKLYESLNHLLWRW